MKRLVVFLLVLILFAAEGNAQADQNKPRTEFNVTFGWAGNDFGIFKSLGYHLIRGFVSAEVSLAIIEGQYPLSGNLTLQVPLYKFVPYVTGGYGYSLAGTGVTNMGAGLKIRLSPSMGILAEYRQFTYNSFGKKKSTLIGAGFAYLF